MKYFITLLVFFAGCEVKKENYCEYKFTDDRMGFMERGGILDKYDNGRTYYSIVVIVNPKDWDYNQYFTGIDFSTNQEDALEVSPQDTCKLKRKYVEFLNLNK